MAYQDPEFSAFQENDVFEHENGQRIKLVYHNVKIQGRQERSIRPYNPPRESLRFQLADEEVDSSNSLSNLSLATGPKEMELLVGGKREGDSADPWRNWKLLRPKPSSDPNEPTEFETLGTLNDVRAYWNNRWPVRPVPDEGDAAGPDDQSDEDQARGKNTKGRKRRSTQGQTRRTSARAGSLSGTVGSRHSQSLRRTSTQAQASAFHGPLLGGDTPGPLLAQEQQYGSQLTYNTPQTYPPVIPQFDPQNSQEYTQQYGGEAAFQQSTYASVRGPMAPPPLHSYQSQLQRLPHDMQQTPSTQHAASSSYAFGGDALVGSQMPQQPHSTVAQQPPAQQPLYQQQLQSWDTDEQTYQQQQPGSGNDIGEEANDEHTFW
ncbi:hypothetical protein G647_05543 [Cladophialophora carrionii CBS 160.54]|uniref:Uncharacterized protein n=1 Tax=Cladophialophora carrionii CBS 160.54 TaxID=1279043 RepID=V9DBQ3_9EURO|nr:uncharacterized protein G647_05543 [Cladophialophora carrionii CBS 160.54]ETI23738.1 hypothetical protein G647_05543 [Cladophialophora carrionii CBS 160.54]